jgi:hypothetical protein
MVLKTEYLSWSNKSPKHLGEKINSFIFFKLKKKILFKKLKYQTIWVVKNNDLI